MARHLLSIAVALVLVITTVSAYLRLSQYGLGCADWPACYGRSPVGDIVLSESSPMYWIRVIHRVTATIAGLIFVALALFWWSQWRRGREQILSLAPLVLAGFLAWLGRYTPSELPAVTLGNLLGGMALLGVLWWLRAAAGARPAHGSGRSLLTGAATIALLLLFLQIALGGMTSARLAAAACTGFPLCGAGGATLSAVAFNPFAAIPLEPSSEAIRQGLHMTHRLSGLLLAALLIGVGVAAVRTGGQQMAAGRWLLGLVAAQLIVGPAMVLAGFSLAIAVVHNLIAGLLVIVLVGLLAAARFE